MPEHALTMFLVACATGLAPVGCSRQTSTPDVAPEAAATSEARSDASDTAEHESEAVQPITTELDLQDGMRRLWRDHVTWTRIFIVASVAGSPDTSATLQRLLKNQVDIGEALKPFFTAGTGDALAAHLRDHITITSEVIAATGASDETAAEKAKKRWSATADQIALLLAAANAHYWPEDAVKTMLRVQRELTLAELQARRAGDWAADAAAYDALVGHALELADLMSSGLAKRFPELVATSSSLTAKGSALHLQMRKLWQDQVTWTRLFVISAIGGLADTAETTAQLLLNQAAIAAALEPFYGPAARDALSALLHEHFTLTAEVIVTAKAAVPSRLADANARWAGNAERIATFFGDLNPHWAKADLAVKLRMHLAQTMGEVSARLTEDWVADIAAYDFVVGHALSIADTLSDGIARQFAEKL